MAGVDISILRTGRSMKLNRYEKPSILGPLDGLAQISVSARMIRSASVVVSPEADANANPEVDKCRISFPT